MVLRQPPPQAHDLRVVRLPFRAAVPGVVVVGAVPVPLEVRLVVLPVEGDQVAQGEPVVAGDEVDAVVGGTPVVGVQVGRPRQPEPEVPKLPAVPLHETAHRVAEPAVPLRPVHGEVPHLVRPQVPRFGDELGLLQHRVLGDGVEEGGAPLVHPALAPQHGGEIEPEPVDVHRLDPVPQRIHHQPDRGGGRQVEGVAATRPVHVVARRVVGPPGQHVVRRIVDPLEGEGGAQLVPLPRVVVHHVEDHLDPRAVQLPHQRLELLHLAPGAAAGAEGRLPGAKKAAVLYPQ